MNRREALSSVGLILGGTIIGSQAFLIGCTPTDKAPLEGILNEDKIALLNEFGEVILPKTEKTPGAKEVNVGSFMNSIVSDFYTTKQQQVFLDGIKKLNKSSDDKFGDSFVNLSMDDRSAVLMDLEKEAGTQMMDKEADDHYYVMLKQLTIWGYLSSEAVATEALEYSPIPGTFFENCIDVNDDVKGMWGGGSSGQARGYATQYMKRNA